MWHDADIIRAMIVGEQHYNVILMLTDLILKYKLLILTGMRHIDSAW